MNYYWFIFVLYMFYPVIYCSPTLPCCDINVKDVSKMASVFEASKIVLTLPQTCQNVNVATIHVKPQNTSVTKTICVNGFNVMSFLLHLFQRISYNHPQALNYTFISYLEKYKEQFAHNFSIQTANSSRFSLKNISSKKGKNKKKKQNTTPNKQKLQVLTVDTETINSNTFTYNG
ncbi:ORF47 [Felid gammaherpesvirus 1]|uniref:ORF47 n=1 Tax=Felid gammaherpesvirus 1 TaxID=2560468 RepID=A0A0M4MS57_9GAMA|nr:ORF47 [Felis catus gammaherpesvirus 1]ALE14758.1 ORF47 [Felis catus gammaherpesvirus 1]